MKRAVPLLAAVALIIFIAPTAANASTHTAVTGLHQTASTPHTITIAWRAPNTASPFNIYIDGTLAETTPSICPDNTPGASTRNARMTYTFAKLHANRSYTVKVVAHNALPVTIKVSTQGDASTPT